MLKKRFLIVGIGCMITALLITPNDCILAAQQGLLLWFNKVLPSLLPFIILINLLISLNIMAPISKVATPLTTRLWHLPGDVAFAFIMGLISGYPMGGKVIKQLIDTHRISKTEGEKALCFSNNCGPLFIIATVGTIMLGNTQLGYFLFFIHLLSALIMSLLLRHLPSSPLNDSLSTHTHPSSPISFATALNNAVQNAMDTMVCIGGYIIFFSVLSHLLTHSDFLTRCLALPGLRQIPSTYCTGILVGILELSNGCATLTTHTTPSIYTLSLLSAVLSFGGICVYFQTLHVLGNTTLSTKSYLTAKCLQSILSYLLSFLFFPLFSVYTLKTYYPFSFKPLIALVLFIVLITYSMRYLNISSKKKQSLSKTNKKAIS